MSDLHNKIHPVVFILVFLLAGCSTSQREDNQIQWLERFNYQTSELSSISIGKHGYPYVRVLVNGRELELALDTANMADLLLATDVANALGLSAVGERKHYDSEGRLIGTFRRYKVDTLKVFGEVWTDVEASEDTRNDVEGYIGPRFLLGKRFTLDYGNKVIAVSSSSLPNYQIVGAVLPMVSSPSHKGLILIRGSVNGREVIIQLDTGKSRTCVDPDLVAELKLPSVAHGYRVDEIKLGPFSFSVRSAKEVGFAGISEGLSEPILVGIGSDIISQMILTVDYSQQSIVISK